MRRTVLGATAAILACGLALVAEDKKKAEHNCPLADVMCPAQGCCEGACRQICDKGGEALAAVKAKVGADYKAKSKKDNPHLSGACKTAGCSDCKTLLDKIYASIIKDKVNARFKAMNGEEQKHEVKQSNGKVKEEKCTLLTGKLCPHCVIEMAAAALEKYEESLKAEEGKK
jgi:hypothetical protein